MARRYQVTKSIAMGTPASATDFAFDEKIDLAVLLSQRLQRNVRQGHVFNLHKIEANLRTSAGASDLDIGTAVQCEAYWCPATKNSVKAWQEAFKVWNAQKKLATNAVGGIVRYDDFEVGWTEAYSDTRTSTIYAGGLNDNTAEPVMLYGVSSGGNAITLEDIWESAQSQPAPSRFPLSNTVVKASKYTQEFPNGRQAHFGAHWSAINDSGAGMDSGAQYNSTPAYISDGASLCGVLSVRGRILPENTIAHTQDDMTLELTFTVSIGTPLVQRTPKRKPKRTFKGKTTRYSNKRMR